MSYYTVDEFIPPLKLITVTTPVELLIQESESNQKLILLEML